MKQVRKLKVHKVLAAVALLSVTSVASAVPINGNFGIFGAYALGDGTGLGDTTSLNLLDVFGAQTGTGDLGNVNFSSTGSSSNPLDFPGIAVNNLFRIEGWQVDIDASTSIFVQNSNNLTISGNGTISCYDTGLCGGNNFDSTLVDWNLSIQNGGSTYSMIVGNTPVPVPAAVWLFGTGLLGLASVARRRRNS